MIGLTRRQLQVLQFITGFVEVHGRAPYRREIAESLGISKGARLHDILLALEERGRIRRVPNTRGAITVLQPAKVARAPDGSPLHCVIPLEAAA